MGCEGIDQRLHALAERHKQPVARATRPRRCGSGIALFVQHRTYETAVLLLHRNKLRHRRLHAQVPRISSIDPANHRLGHAFQGLSPQTAGHELRQRFVFCGGATWHHQIERHTQLPVPAKHWRSEERPPRPRGHQIKPLWDRHQSATTHDKTLAVLCGGADELVAQSQFLTQTYAPGLGRQKTVRPLFHEQFVLMVRRNGPAQTPTGLQQDHLQWEPTLLGGLGEAIRGRQPSNASANHHHPLACAVHTTSSASRRLTLHAGAQPAARSAWRETPYAFPPWPPAYTSAHMPAPYRAPGYQDHREPRHDHRESQWEPLSHHDSPQTALAVQRH